MSRKRQSELQEEEFKNKIRDTSGISNINLNFGRISDHSIAHYKTSVKTFSVHVNFEHSESLRQCVLSVEAILQTIVQFAKEDIHPDEFLGVS